MPKRLFQHPATTLLHYSLEQSKRVEEFWHECRLPTKVAAIRRLIELGLEVAKRDPGVVSRAGTGA
jgi:hypothetical protein